MARALRYDGIIPVKLDIEGSFSAFTAEDVRDLGKYAKEHRAQTSPFDIVVEGVTPVEHPYDWDGIVGPLAEAGATW